jgi:hypothetical protein
MENRRKILSAQNIFFFLIFLLALSLLSTFYFYRKAANDPQKVAVDELNRTVEAVGKMLLLPSDETPSLATVSDPAKLREQQFFAHAESGDKVLIYSLAKRAILYRPQLNKIVEVAPINLGQAGAGGSR